MGERVFITGGAGYIGSVLTPLLLKKGYQVTVLDNLSFKQAPLLESFSNPQFRFIHGDACDEALISEEVPKADILIPLAALVGAPACDRAPFLATVVNRDAIALLLKHSSPRQKILYPNTNSGYGAQGDGICTEETPVNPVSHYGRLKIEGETILLNSGRALSFRLATVFGISPRMRLDLLVNDFTFRACHDRFVVLFEEHFKRNHVHVRDVANAFCFGIEHFEEMRGNIYNLGRTDANLTKKELCEKIRQYIPSFYVHYAKIGEDPDKRDYLVSNAKLEGLGWRAEVSLDEGIREMITAYPMLRSNSSFKNV